MGEMKEGTEERGDWKTCGFAKNECLTSTGERVIEGKCGAAWQKCGEEVIQHKKGRKGEWKACDVAKEKCMRNGEKSLDGRCGAVWKECGDEVKEGTEERGDWKACGFAKNECSTSTGE